MIKVVLWLWFIVWSIGCSNLPKKTKANEIAQSRINLGLAYLHNEQWQRARQNLEMAVSIAPTNVAARIGFAHYLQRVNEDAQAELQYKKALDFAPDEPDLLNNYGAFLCRLGKYAQAEQAFLGAIHQKSYYKLSTSYENAGLCAIKFNYRSKAKNWFKKALNHEPNRYLSTLYLLNIEMEEGAFDMARQRLASFHELYGYQASTLLMLIRLESLKDQTEQMKKYARLLAEQFPQSQEYKQYLDNEF